MKRGIENQDGDSAMKKKKTDLYNLTLSIYLFQLFQRCLTKVLNIDLWRLYVTYVKETKSSLPTYRYAIRCVVSLLLPTLYLLLCGKRESELFY